MAVSYTVKGEAFSAEPSRVWSSVIPVTAPGSYTYDLAPDGKRIVTFLPYGELDNQKPLAHLTLLLNFFDELRRRAPGRN